MFFIVGFCHAVKNFPLKYRFCVYKSPHSFSASLCFQLLIRKEYFRYQIRNVYDLSQYQISLCLTIQIY